MTLGDAEEDAASASRRGCNTNVYYVLVPETRVRYHPFTSSLASLTARFFVDYLLCHECAFDDRKFETHRPTHILLVIRGVATTAEDQGITSTHHHDGEEPCGDISARIGERMNSLEERMSRLEVNMEKLLSEIAKLVRA